MTDAVAARAPSPSVAATPNRWLPALVFFVTLVVASVLLFVRVSSTSIELTGTFTGLGFVSERQQPLGRPIRVSALGAAGVKVAELPEEVRAVDATALRDAVDESGGTGKTGSIVVDRIMVPDGTQVWLARTDVPRQYRLSLRAPSAATIEVHADVMGAVSFAPSASAPTATVLRAPRAVELVSSGGALDLREDGIAATFQGDVREMHSGSGDEPQSLMPTLLEWLRKRQALSLLWGTAIYLSGIALTLRRWWRKPE